jgi:peptidoglycan/LPS O-acetylase OafA/YrhL
VSIPGSAFVVVVSGATGTAGTRGATVSTTYAPTSTAPAPSRSDRRSPSLRRTTVVVGLGAAAAVTAVAAALQAAGVSLTVPGGEIPLAAFAQMTFVGAVLGGVLLAVLNRRSAQPRHRFLQTTIALTALSCIPSIASPPDVATKVALVMTHLVAAAIIVPVLARHAHD